MKKKATVKYKAADGFASGTKKVSLLSGYDKVTLVSFLCIFIFSVFLYYVFITMFSYSTYMAFPVLALPLFVIGATYYIVKRRYYALIVVIAVCLVVYYFRPPLVLYILYFLICTEGVATMVEVIQRLVFYGTLETIEYVNVKEKLSIKEKLVVFFFNIPVDLDTRNLTIDRSVKRNKFSWKDMLYSFMMVLLFCMFLWMYVFLNPSISMETRGVPIYTLTIILYISMLVMPWSIFNTLNARIVTDYRDFKIYHGLLGTFKRMFLPMIAAVLFLAYALVSSPESYYFVAVSMVMILLILLFTTIMYFTSNEVSVISDIEDNWEKFHPTTIYSRYASLDQSSSLDDGVPGTPRRDPAECFSPDVKGRSR